MTITATADQVREADVAEHVMLAYWRTCLAHGRSADLVASLIVNAVDYQPLLGIQMDQCQGPGCETWVDERARDHAGRIHCSDQCAADDPTAEAGWEFHEAHRDDPKLGEASYIGFFRQMTP